MSNTDDLKPIGIFPVTIKATIKFDCRGLGIRSAAEHDPAKQFGHAPRLREEEAYTADFVALKLCY
jgi:hypothetical protein